jgi:glycosyltransferase involved in cell wall biosynthesis
VFVVPWRLARAAPAADDLVRIALAASGVPVVASDAGSDVLAHERNGFLVRDGDLAGYRATIARLLDLPARQRHFMGAEFAAWTLRRWPVDAAVETYDSRLRALSGRVEIPFELRAAA